jgi:hypothetical protein
VWDQGNFDPYGPDREVSACYDGLSHAPYDRTPQAYWDWTLGHGYADHQRHLRFHEEQVARYLLGDMTALPADNTNGKGSQDDDLRSRLRAALADDGGLTARLRAALRKGSGA